MYYSLRLLHVLLLRRNTEGKYLKSLIELGADVISITTLTYQL
jgi:hypothetical protein